MKVIKNIICVFVFGLGLVALLPEQSLALHDCGPGIVKRYPCPLENLVVVGEWTLGGRAAGDCGCNDMTYDNCIYPEQRSDSYWEYQGECSRHTRQKRSFWVSESTYNCPEKASLSQLTPLPAPIVSYSDWQNANSECTTECTPGQKKYKYTADSGGCDYTMEENTCCANGYWSGLGGECTGAMLCDGTETCWNGSSCVSNVVTRDCKGNVAYTNGGTQTGVASGCVPGSGWSSASDWKGICTCKGLMFWNYKSQECQLDCSSHVSDEAESCRNCGGIWTALGLSSCSCICTNSQYMWDSEKQRCVHRHDGTMLECK